MTVDDPRFWARVDRSAGTAACWPWTGARHERGYGQVRIGGRLMRAHRYAISAPPGTEVMHSCDNPPCCNPAHLSIGTHTENMAGMAARGRARPPRITGESNHLATITDDEVVLIRVRAADGVSVDDIARAHAVHRQTIQRIVTGRSRAEAGGPIRAPRAPRYRKEPAA